MEFGILMTDIPVYVTCKFKMYIIKIALVIGENVCIAFLYVLSIYTFKNSKLLSHTTCIAEQTMCLDSDHSPSLIRVISGMRSLDSYGPKLSSCGQRRLWSCWMDAQVDPSLCYAQTFQRICLIRISAVYHFICICQFH